VTLSFWLYPLLFLTGLAAGFVDAIAGGGGLITLPVLLSTGMTPQEALGTNKLQAVFGSGSAAWHYQRAGLVDFRKGQVGVLFTFIGASAGSLLVLQMKPDLLRQLIPWLLIAVAFYLLFQPRLGEKDIHPRMDNLPFHFLFGLGLGFYDGFIGPGTGTFWAMAYMLGLGFNLTRATAHTKVMNFTSNVASLGIFLFSGQMNYAAGLCMAGGQLLGARLGARAVIRRGTKFIRPVFILVALAVTARLLWQNYSRR
jgi:uncharacterized membrane protein YfcA